MWEIREVEDLLLLGGELMSQRSEEVVGGTPTPGGAPQAFAPGQGGHIPGVPVLVFGEQQQQQDVHAASRALRRTSSEPPPDPDMRRRVHTVDRTRIASANQQGGRAGSSGDGGVAGAPQGNTGGGLHSGGVPNVPGSGGGGNPGATRGFPAGGSGNMDWQQMQQMCAAMMRMMHAERETGKDKRKENWDLDGTGRVVLEGEYFRKIDVFERDRSRFRHWLFDFSVAIWTNDKKLATELDRLMKSVLGDKWDPETDSDVD